MSPAFLSNKGSPVMADAAAQRARRSKGMPTAISAGQAVDFLTLLQNLKVWHMILWFWLCPRYTSILSDGNGADNQAHRVGAQPGRWAREHSGPYVQDGYDGLGGRGCERRHEQVPQHWHQAARLTMPTEHCIPHASAFPCRCIRLALVHDVAEGELVQKASCQGVLLILLLLALTYSSPAVWSGVTCNIIDVLGPARFPYVACSAC